ncbi:hypothetical protein NA57DRAFT_70289 [Rhizodiscina lignyota]|uniref:Uncharacterized protein n=1 Tax=Rhizodiscina lignyota TaxID=1504668 RepID=A0A9P4IRJ9_9PEZI|nr:hypothetical protein NA57DRAFT_70289 [Rhizodiscina lignyota]
MTDSESPPSGIKSAPGPWLNLPVTTYMFSFWSSPPLLDHAYAPLEAASSCADPKESGAFRGGVSLIEIVRYHDTPVGPYDELAIVPGSFDVTVLESKGKKMKQMPRHNDTCWNGRHNWNIPKHLAKFSYSTDPKTSTLSVKVSAPDADAKPFFSVDLSMVRYLPSFPFSTNIAKYFGVEMCMAQPPLPSGVKSPKLLRSDEDPTPLCGTSEWRFAIPEVWGKASLCWVNQTVPSKQTPNSAGQTSDGAEANETDRLLPQTDSENSGVGWPSYRPWPVGLWIEEGKINFQDAHVDGLKAK